MASAAPATEKDKSKVHKLSLKGSAKLVAEFVSPSVAPHRSRNPTNLLSLSQFQYSIHTILYAPPPTPPSAERP
jgi:hypothetical protein